MNPLTIHLLTKNNEETIIQTLDSLLPLDATILVGDAGSRDKTTALCQKYGEVVRVSANKDRSHARNEMLRRSKTEWQMYVEPWEMLINGHERIAQIIKDGPKKNYHCDVLQGDVITKQVRLWRKDSGKEFTNPVFESIVDEKSEYAEVMFYRDKKEEDQSEKIEAWKKSKPLAVEPYYYQACDHLAKRQYKEFLALADHYLFQQKTASISTTMTRYYLGIVHCYVTNNLEAATRNALTCVGEHLLMAEFWCLLGDIFFQGREFDKAATFYDNAKLLGSHRLRSDKWPMHISKYDEYPTEMIAKCQAVLSQAKHWAAKSKSNPIH
jgi:glycosyltransferase involved in cell wall biosynthesis